MHDSVFIMGPTGVGKTDLLCNLRFNEPLFVINVDSVQIYKDLFVGFVTDINLTYPDKNNSFADFLAAEPDPVTFACSTPTMPTSISLFKDLPTFAN